MRYVKKWLFPILTCLIAAGALVLPPYLSQLRDARQFGHVYTELLSASALPAREPPDLPDRLALYARWSSSGEVIPSFQSPEEQYREQAEEAARGALDRLSEAGALPGWLMEGLELTSWSYILLWNPDTSIAAQNPVAVWRVTAEFDPKTWSGSLWMDVDAESGLPLGFSVYHGNMAQWLPYTMDGLQQRMEQYFTLLGLGVEQMDPADSGLVLDCAVAGADIIFRADHNATLFSVHPSIASYGPLDADG